MTDDLEQRLRTSAPRPAGTADLTAATVAAADDRGLVDIAFAELDTPVGTLLAATTPRGLVLLEYVGGGSPDDTLARLARLVSPRVLELPGRLAGVSRQLDDYFTGRRREFDLPIDWQLVGGAFGRRVLEAAARIPFGEVRTYSEVAGDAGNPRASRAAGNALGANPVPIVVPCHRVVRTGGGLGGYTGGLEIKRHLLALEGVAGV